MRTVKWKVINSSARFRAEGYIEKIRAVGKDVGEAVELTEEQFVEIRDAFPKLDAPKLPSILQQGANLLLAGVEESVAMIRGDEPVSDEAYSERLAICKSNKCGHFIADQTRCAKCGCFLETKAHWRSQKCPLLLW